jgi:hypothetical protein
VSLQRLVLTFKPDGIEVRTLYKTHGGPRPNTKARTKEVTELTRTGLTQALEALESAAECVGTSGFTTREDVLLATTSSDAPRKVKRGAA